MGISQRRPRPPWRALGTGVGYLLLLVLGVLQGMIGSFQYAASPVPLFAIILDLAIFATCMLAGWGLRTYGAGILPALGWLAASFTFAMPHSDGSVIITATTAGEWYLYGGALAAMAGAAIAFVTWGRSGRTPGSLTSVFYAGSGPSPTCGRMTSWIPTSG